MMTGPFAARIAVRLLFIAAAFAATAPSVRAAGSGGRQPGDNGLAVKAQVNDPTAVAVDGSKKLYIVEQFSRIRRVDLRTGIITTVLTKAPLNAINSLVVDGQGNLIAAESLLHRVSRVDPRTGSVTLIAGGKRGFSGDGGPAAAAELDSPSFVAIDAADNVYIADSFNHRIRRVGTDGTITTIAKVSLPQELALDREGDILVSGFGTSSQYQDLQRVDMKSGVIATVAGLTLTAGLQSPNCLIFDRTGKLYVLGPNEDSIHSIDSRSLVTADSALASVGIRAGSPSTIHTQLCGGRMAFDSEGNLFVADFSGHRVRRISVRTGLIQIVAGNGLPHHVHVLQ